MSIDDTEALLGGLELSKRHAAQLATDALHRALQGVASSSLSLIPASQSGGMATSPAADGCHAPQRNPRRNAAPRLHSNACSSSIGP